MRSNYFVMVSILVGLACLIGAATAGIQCNNQLDFQDPSDLEWKVMGAQAP